MRSLMKGALVGAAMLFASAAAANAGTLEVNVPFAFMVGSQQMPAGVYRIERDLWMPSSVVLIRGQHGTAAQLFVQTTPLNGANPAGSAPALVFVPDEGGKRLTQVWESSSGGEEFAGGRHAARLADRTIVVGRPRS
ncbi:MAG: hypothetical protein ACRD3G_27235 [Vicinamibacterales bacterium]